MNVVVCAKQIPDPAQPGELDPQTKTLKREGKLILDDSDAYGVEMGLQLADKAGGGEVTLVSMAPNSEVSGLRTALAMGAAKAILISDEALQGSDSLGTAKVLAAAIKRAEPDLVLTATESTDGYTGVLPAQLAELLGWPSITFAKHIEVADGKAKVQRQNEEGYDEVESPLPAIVSVSSAAESRRSPAAARRKRSPRPTASTGPPRCTPPTLATRFSARPSVRRWRPRSKAATSPTSCSSARPTTAATWPGACRPSSTS